MRSGTYGHRLMVVGTVVLLIVVAGIFARQQAESSSHIVAENLYVPWAVDFLPDGSLIFTERSGNVKLIRKRTKQPVLIKHIDQVAAIGEGGLLGLAVDPNYTKNRFVYVYYTYRSDGRLFNKVVRYKSRNSTLVEDTIIVDKIPGSVNHNAGRIKFGPDGRLYIATGDSQQPNLAQDKNSLAGKILRVEANGKIPADNPFPKSPIYSLGHRDPQGLAWDNKGRLWSTEHGDSGNDEINLIKPGRNYGWPIIEDGQGRSGLEKPVIYSGRDTWAPSGIAFHDGLLYFAGLRGQAVFSLNPQKPRQPKRLFLNEFGRIRDVVVGPDSRLYISTSNRDGRGIAKSTDDRIIRINPSQ
jgi:glucose/arabinose dehydrogenase